MKCPMRLSALLAIPLAAVACVAPPGPPGYDRLEQPSLEVGGSVGREQLFVSPAGEPFRAAAGEPYPVAAWFDQADVDHDAKLTQDEFLADTMRFFQRLDEDNDDQIEPLEVRRYEEHLVPEMRSRIRS